MTEKPTAIDTKSALVLHRLAFGHALKNNFGMARISAGECAELNGNYKDLPKRQPTDCAQGGFRFGQQLVSLLGGIR
jgi:hypothetical protein